MKLKLYFFLFLAMCQQLFAQNDYYWVGGTGNWSDLNHWRIGSTSGPQATIIPSRYDNVSFTSGSGFSAAGGAITISSSAICKDFTVDDSFAGKIRFGSNGVVFNIYGNLKWRGDIGGTYNLTVNLYSDSSNPSPNTIDIQGNMIDPGYLSSNYSSSINFLGTGSFNLINNFNSNGYFSFNVSENAILINNSKNVTVATAINYTSSAVSDFGTAVITNTGGTSSFNANANLTQATVSSYSLTIPTTQNIKNIILRSGGISVGTLLTADNITGTGGGQLYTSNGTGSYDINTVNFSGASGYTIGGSITSNIANFKVNTMTMGDGNNSFYASNNIINNLTLGSGNNTFVYGYAAAYSINNLTLNGSSCYFNNTTGSGFNVNQTLVVNTVCKGTLPSFGGGTSYNANLVLPPGINGTGMANFPGYTFNRVKLTGGGSASSTIDGGGNTGNISFTGIPAANTYYRIGGGGAWNDPSKWSLSSGGISANCVPTMYDDVIFDAASGFAVGNLGITGTNVACRNMTWNNASNNPVFNLNTIIYGNLTLQKDMVATDARFSFLKYNSTNPVANRYIKFEGQTVSYVTAIGNDNFYLVPASWAATDDVTVTNSFLMDNNGLTGAIFADGIKINGTNAIIHIGGNSASIDNTIIRAKTFYLLTKLSINASNASVYVSQDYNGAYLSTSSNSHFIGSVYKEGATAGSFTNMKAGLFQVNSGSGITFYNTNTVKDVNITVPVNIIMNSGANLKVTDTFAYNRADCDNVMEFTGNAGNNLILGNNINSNGFVELNRMNITGINAVYVTPVVGAKPVNANNSIDNGNNSGINFTVPAAKNFYWKGGSGSWNDLSHWSLDPSAARVTANCGLPTIYDNVFFDQYSGFLAGNIRGIQLDNNVSVNDMTFSGLPAAARSYFSGNNNYYYININGNLTLHPGYYDAGYFYGFNFINTGKAAGINKSVYPNGANSYFNFTGNANWKVHHGTTAAKDMNGGGISQASTAGTVDLSNTILQLSTFSFSGKEVLLNGSDITAINGNVNFNTQLPVISNNSILRISTNSNTIFSANNLAHYFERIDITSDIYFSYGKTFSLPNGLINYLNVLPSLASVDAGNYSVTFSNLEVNHLNIQKRNIINFGNIKIHQSMLLQGGCTEAERLIIQSGTLTIPNYTSTNFVIDKVRLRNASSSAGQTYVTSSSKDLGGNTGFSFPDIISSAPRDMYWIGGSGDWSDSSHWSLSSGGNAITTCDPPRSNDNVFFDQNSGFTSASKTVSVVNTGLANNVTFESDPNSPVISSSIGNMLNVYGNFVTQSNTVFSSNNTINMIQSPVPGQIRYIDTKGASYTKITMNTSQDNFELLSTFAGEINGYNITGFKTNNYSVNGNLVFAYTIGNNPVLDFGQSVINSPTFTISSNTINHPVTIFAENTKITSYLFTLNIPNVSSFGDVIMSKDGVLDTKSIGHSFNKVTFLGSTNTNTVSRLASTAGNYKTLYFNPGTYTIASGQTVTENLFMTGTPCNRINVSRAAASGQSTINLDPAATYTMFYASVRDINFSRPVNAYGNSQDLGNTTNLTIVPTNVQAAGFGGSKTLCSLEFPKTYDAVALYGTDPNASYIWTKIGAPNAGIISTSPSVTFTQPGNYSVKVVYAQDGCNITENFTISSVVSPVDSTTATTTNVLQQATGDVVVTFKGSLNNQTYIFTYSINNGPDMEVTSNAGGVATLSQPRNVTGTFVYHLKGIRFASGMACPVVVGNKDIVVNINPECITPGVVQLYGSELRGCTATAGARRLAELSPVTIANPPAEANIAQLIPGTGIVIREGTNTFLLRNTLASPETLTGLPANKPHSPGAIIYHNDHFYEGVGNERWIRIDND